MDSADVSRASWNYFHPTIYPNEAETNGFKKFTLGAAKVLSYFTVIIPIIMLAVHHRSTTLALGEKGVYKLPIFEQDPDIKKLAINHLSLEGQASPEQSVAETTPPPVPPKFIQTTVTSKADKEAKIEKDQLEFVDAIFGDKDLHQTVEMIITNVNNINQSIQLIVDGYSEYRKAKGLSEIDSAQKEHLLKFMAYQIQGFHKPSLEPTKSLSDGKVPSMEAELPNGYALKVYKTNGNGSCGIHALVGEPKGNQYEADGATIRRDFCAELRELRKSQKLPERIQQVLRDYLEFPDRAPAKFSNNRKVKAACRDINKYREELGKLRIERQEFLRNIELVEKAAISERIEAKRAELQREQKSDAEIEQDKDLQALKQALKDYSVIPPPESDRLALLEKEIDDRITRAIYDKTVFEAYLGCLQEVGQYLLQDELVAIANSLGKRVVLFQPGWGKFRDQLQYAELTSDGSIQIKLEDINADEVVCIYYNGYNHYERAELVVPTL